jgi:hypothetical protein
MTGALDSCTEPELTSKSISGGRKWVRSILAMSRQPPLKNRSWGVVTTFETESSTPTPKAGDRFPLPESCLSKTFEWLSLHFQLTVSLLWEIIGIRIQKTQIMTVKSVPAAPTQNFSDTQWFVNDSNQIRGVARPTPPLTYAAVRDTLKVRLTSVYGTAHRHIFAAGQSIMLWPPASCEPSFDPRPLVHQFRFSRHHTPSGPFHRSGCFQQAQRVQSNLVA